MMHVFFGDAAHFVVRPFGGGLYSRTTRFVKAAAGRKRSNGLGALNAMTKEITVFTNFTSRNSFSIWALLDTRKAQYAD